MPRRPPLYFSAALLSLAALGCNAKKSEQIKQASADVTSVTSYLGPKLDAIGAAVVAQAPAAADKALPFRDDASSAKTAMFEISKAAPALTSVPSAAPCMVGEDGRLFTCWSSLDSPLKEQKLLDLFPALANAKTAPTSAIVHWPQLQSGGFEGDAWIYAAPAKTGLLVDIVDVDDLLMAILRDVVKAPPPAEREVQLGLFDGPKSQWTFGSNPLGDAKSSPRFESETANGPASGSAPGITNDYAWAAARVPQLGPHAGVVVAREIK